SSNELLIPASACERPVRGPPRSSPAISGACTRSVDPRTGPLGTLPTTSIPGLRKLLCLTEQFVHRLYQLLPLSRPPSPNSLHSLRLHTRRLRITHTSPAYRS